MMMTVIVMMVVCLPCICCTPGLDDDSIFAKGIIWLKLINPRTLIIYLIKAVPWSYMYQSYQSGPWDCSLGCPVGRNPCKMLSQNNFLMMVIISSEVYPDDVIPIPNQNNMTQYDMLPTQVHSLQRHCRWWSRLSAKALPGITLGLGHWLFIILQSLGLVTVLPWRLDMTSQKEIRTEGLFAALNDCLYRWPWSLSSLPFVIIVIAKRIEFNW